MGEKPGRYSNEEAELEASHIQKIIKEGKAENYPDAEKVLNAEKKKELESALEYLDWALKEPYREARIVHPSPLAPEGTKDSMDNPSHNTAGMFNNAMDYLRRYDFDTKSRVELLKAAIFDAIQSIFEGAKFGHTSKKTAGLYGSERKNISDPQVRDAGDALIFADIKYNEAYFNYWNVSSGYGYLGMEEKSKEYLAKAEALTDDEQQQLMRNVDWTPFNEEIERLKEKFTAHPFLSEDERDQILKDAIKKVQEQIDRIE